MNNSLWTVMSFTMRNKFRSKGFIVMTAIFAVLVIVAGNLPYLIDKLGGGDKVGKVGYAESVKPEIVQGLKDYYGAQPKPDIEVLPFASEQEMKDALEDGDVNGYVVFAEDASGAFPAATYYSKSAFGGNNSSSLTAALQAVKTDLVIKDAGMTEEQQQRLQEPVSLKAEQVSFTNAKGKTQEEQGVAMGLTYVLLILTFMSVMITGQLIATEITAEKSSRVMEILVTSVSPLKQMWGKILGTFIVSIMQIAVLVVAFAVNISLPHNEGSLDRFGINLNDIDPTMLAYAVLLFLAGFILYSTLFAAIGSIVSRTEDLGQATMPVTLLTLAGFYIAIFGFSQPDSPLILVCQYIPFFSPFLLFLRIGISEPEWWEIAVSLGILAITILGIGWLSAKIYRVGVLMYGKKPSLKEVFKAMRAFKV